MVKFDSNRTYGIEIEMSWGRGNRAPSQETVASALRRAGLDATAEGYTHSVTSGWTVVSDGSVGNGHELVSPILRGLDGKEQLKTAMRAVKAIGATTDASCGVHVHHGAQRPLGGEPQGALPPDSGRRSGDEGSLALQPFSHSSHGASIAHAGAGLAGLPGDHWKDSEGHLPPRLSGYLCLGGDGPERSGGQHPDQPGSGASAGLGCLPRHTG